MLDYYKNQLDQIHHGKTWYGNNLSEVLHKIPFKNISLQIHPTAHTIGQIFEHMIAWRLYVIDKIYQKNEFEIDIGSDQDWPKIREIQEKEWHELQLKFAGTQISLMDALDSLNEDTLDSISPNGKHTYNTLINGIIYHDVYHLGQIAMLNNLLKA